MSKSRHYNSTDYDDYDDDYMTVKKSSKESKRRGIKNWKKAWVENAEDYEDVDDFFTK